MGPLTNTSLDEDTYATLLFTTNMSPNNVILLLLIFTSDFLGLYCEMHVGIIPQIVLNVVPSGEQVFCCCCLCIWFNS